MLCAASVEAETEEFGRRTRRQRKAGEAAKSPNPLGSKGRRAASTKTDQGRLRIIQPSADGDSETRRTSRRLTLGEL